MKVRSDAFQFDQRTLFAARRATQLLVGSTYRLGDKADEVRRLLAQITPHEALLYWGHERVVALAVERATSVGVVHDEWTDAVRAVREQAADLNDIQEVVARQVFRALTKRGIQPVLFKGAFMARQVYCDRDLRGASGDIDVLVSPAHLEQASAVVQAMGWTAPTDRRIEHGLPNYHLSHLSPGDAPEIELHWRVQWYDTGEHTALTLRRSVDRSGVSIPSPTDVLSILLFCYARDGFHKLRLAADIAMWWEQFGVDAGLAALDEFGAGPLARPLLVAARAANAIVGTPAPDAGFNDGAARAAVRVAQADRPLTEWGSMSQIALTDVLLAPRGQRLRRWSRGWARDTGAPWRGLIPTWLEPAIVPLFRLAIFARTATYSGFTAWRAIQQTRVRSPR